MVRDNPKLQGFLSGGMAAVGATTITNPIELVKTRLQLQGELKMVHERPYKGIAHAFKTIYKTEGIFGLQKGLLPAYGAQILLNGGRLGFYPIIKGILNVNPESALHIPASILAGALSGAMSATIASPVDLIKVRMQAQSPTVYLGHSYNYKNTFDAFATVFRAEGIRGLTRGAFTSAQRTAVGSSVQLPTYEYTKKFILRHKWLNDDFKCYLLSSMTAGFCATLAMNPFDVARTRMYNQKVSASGEGAYYRSMVDCLIKTVRSEGFFALYKGFGAHYLRLGPHTILIFVLWEECKKIIARL